MTKLFLLQQKGHKFQLRQGCAWRDSVLTFIFPYEFLHSLVRSRQSIVRCIHSCGEVVKHPLEYPRQQGQLSGVGGNANSSLILHHYFLAYQTCLLRQGGERIGYAIDRCILLL